MAIGPTNTEQGFAALDDHTYCLLTSFRKSGEGVGTPVWFALDGDVLYVKTGVESGKVKRIRNDPRVEVEPCTLRGKSRGPAVEGLARVIADPAEEARAEQTFKSRYGVSRPLILGALHIAGVKELYLEVVRP